MTNLLYQKEERRLQAVLSLLRGDKADDVSSRFRIAHSDLYKFKKRALEAMRIALKDQPRGSEKPHNRISSTVEQKIVSLCKRYPTVSSYKIINKQGTDRIMARTIQRIRKRNNLARVPVRAPAVTTARRLPKQIVQRAKRLIREKPHLGPQRISWDLENGENMKISPSSVKRLKRAMNPPEPKPVWKFYERHHPHSLWHGDFMEKICLTDTMPVKHALQLTLLDDYSRGYVFCDLFINPDQRHVVCAMIDAMRKWCAIPEMVIFDNGSEFKGNLIETFCNNMGIRLTHTSVRHPQTNGKLERAFRDDMKDFYQQYAQWHLDELRHDLPGDVYYRNYVRGHEALHGKPSSTRLGEQTRVRVTNLELLKSLESLASYEVKRKIIPADGNIQLFGRNAYLGEHLAGIEVTFFETLEGLEARVENKSVGLLRNYRDMLQLTYCYWDTLPDTLYFENENLINCP